MTQTKWYQKPIYLMVALALVLSFSLVAAVPAGANGGTAWSDNFNGGPQQTWAVVDLGDNSSHLFQNNRYELHTESVPADLEKGLASYVSVSADACIIQGRVQRIAPSDNFLAYLILRGDFAGGNGYIFGASVDGSHFWFGKLATGAYQDITPTYYEATAFDPADFQLRFAVYGNNLAGKVWTTGTTEPDHWQIKATDNNYTGGVGGVMIATYPFLHWNVVQAAFDDVSFTPLSQSEVWVDDSWAGASAGKEVEAGKIFGYNAFAIIQDGIDAVAQDGMAHVRAGEYDEHLVINKSLTLQSTDGWQDTTIDPAVQSIIRIEGDVDVTVQGFEITAGSYGIYIGEVWSTVNILDCFIHDNDFGGIRVVGGGDLLHIEGNIITQNGAADTECGIHIDQAWNTTNILYNVIGAWWDGEDEGTIYAGNNGDGVRIDDVPVESDVTIADNLIVANGDDGIDFPSVISVHGSVNIEDNVIGAWVYDYGTGGVYPFAGNGGHGIHIGEVTDTGSVNIEANAISENGDDGINFGQGVSAIYGTITILQNFIGGWTCYSGDYGYTGSPERYTGNFGEGIYIHQVGDTGTVTIEDNKISENGYDTGIYIEYIYGEVTIAENDIGAWEDSHGETYLGNVGQGVYVYWVYEGAVLTIGPDNSIKENTDDGIEIFNAQPAGAATVTVHHNTIDHNYSDGIELGTPCEVDGATISHNTITNHEIGIHMTGPSDHNIISDNEIRNNQHGIWVEGSDNQILRNNILNNQGGIRSGIHLTSTAERNIIHCNNIVGNLPYGVYNENADEAVDATGNWWGCIEGPGAAGCDLVFGNVIYDPWLPDEFQYCSECREAPPPPGVPTVNHWGIAAMITVFTGLLVWAVRRRRLAS